MIHVGERVEVEENMEKEGDLAPDHDVREPRQWGRRRWKMKVGAFFRASTPSRTSSPSSSNGGSDEIDIVSSSSVEARAKSQSQRPCCTMAHQQAAAILNCGFLLLLSIPG